MSMQEIPERFNQNQKSNLGEWHGGEDMHADQGQRSLQIPSKVHLHT